MYLNYDINKMYQAMVDTIHSLWPIIAAGIAIAMVTMLLSGVVTIFKKWIGDED